MHRRKLTHIVTTKIPIKIVKFSDLKKLLRTNAFVLHAIRNFKNPESRNLGPLQPSEIEGAQSEVLKSVQSQNFAEEIKDLQAIKAVAKNSSILKLDPFLDENGLLRVGGRLSQSD